MRNVMFVLTFVLGLSNFCFADGIKEYKCSARHDAGGSDFGNITAWLVLDGANSKLSIISTDYFDRLKSVKIEETPLGIVATGVSTLNGPEGVSYFNLLVPRIQVGSANASDIRVRGLMVSNRAHETPMDPAAYKLLDYTKFKFLECGIKI